MLLIAWFTCENINFLSFLQMDQSTNAHDFDLQLENNEQIYFHVLKFDRSFFLWIGTSAQFGDLSLALPSFDRSDDVTSKSCKLLGNKSERFGETLAQKLSSKTNCQVFVSCHLSADVDENLHRNIELKIFDELKKFPEKFL